MEVELFFSSFFFVNGLPSIVFGLWHPLLFFSIGSFLAFLPSKSRNLVPQQRRFFPSSVEKRKKEENILLLRRSFFFSKKRKIYYIYLFFPFFSLPCHFPPSWASFSFSKDTLRVPSWAVYGTVKLEFTKAIPYFMYYMLYICLSKL